jgi:hypothetical protein
VSIAAAARLFFAARRPLRTISAMLLLAYVAVVFAATSAVLFTYAWTVQAVARAPAREAERRFTETGES